MPEQRGLEADHRRRASRTRASRVLRGHRDREQDEAGGGQAEAPPLTAADLEAEDAVGHDGDHRDAAGERRPARSTSARATAPRRAGARRARRRPCRSRTTSSDQSSAAVCSGWRMSTAGAAQAPRCLKKNARFVPKAQSSARRMPSWSVMQERCAGPSPVARAGDCPCHRHPHRAGLTDPHDIGYSESAPAVAPVPRCPRKTPANRCSWSTSTASSRSSASRPGRPSSGNLADRGRHRHT